MSTIIADEINKTIANTTLVNSTHKIQSITEYLQTIINQDSNSCEFMDRIGFEIKENKVEFSDELLMLFLNEFNLKLKKKNSKENVIYYLNILINGNNTHVISSTLCLVYV